MDRLWQQQELDRIRRNGLDKTNPNPQLRQTRTAGLSFQVPPELNKQNEPKSVEEVEALMDRFWEQELERIRQAGLDKTNPNPQVRQTLTAALNSQGSAPKTEQTNPNRRTVAA